jgi:hypothetical protein
MYRERLASADSVPLGRAVRALEAAHDAERGEDAVGATPNGRCRRRTAPPGERTTAFARPGADRRISVSHSRR